MSEKKDGGRKKDKDEIVSESTTEAHKRQFMTRSDEKDRTGNKNNEITIINDISDKT